MRTGRKAYAYPCGVTLDTRDRTPLAVVLPLAAVAGTAVAAPEFAAGTGLYLVGLIAVVQLLRGAKLGGPEIISAIFASWYVLSTTWSDRQTVQTGGTSDLVSALLIVGVPLGYFVTIRLTATDRRSFALVGWGFVLGCFIAQMRLVFQSGLGVSDLLYSLVSLEVLNRFEYERVSFGDINFNYLAYSFVGGAAVLLYVLRQLPSKGWRLVLAATYFLTCILGLTLTGTRGALLGGVLFIAWLLVAKWIPRTSMVVLALGALVVQVQILFGLTGGPVDAIRGEGADTLSGRTEIWEMARAMFSDHAVFGAGAGTFRRMWEVEAHNFILNLGTGTGLIGILLFSFLLWFALRTHGSAHAFYYTGALIAASLPAFLSGVWELAVPAWMMIGIFSAGNRIVATSTPGTDSESPRVSDRGDHLGRVR